MLLKVPPKETRTGMMLRLTMNSISNPIYPYHFKQINQKTMCLIVSPSKKAHLWGLQAHVDQARKDSGILGKKQKKKQGK